MEEMRIPHEGKEFILECIDMSESGESLFYFAAADDYSAHAGFIASHIRDNFKTKKDWILVNHNYLPLARFHDKELTILIV